MSQKSRVLLRGQLSFLFLLVIIFLLPIPLGSNRPWAWNFFQLLIFSLGLQVCVVDRVKLGETFKIYSTSIFLFLTFIIISAIQIIPLPYSILDVVSPSSASTYKSFGASFGYISVDRGQSTITLFKTLSLFILFLVVLTITNNEARVRLLLATMLASGTFQAIYGAFEVLSGIEKSLVHQLPVTDIATGSFVYKNHYANFLMLCLCAGIGLIVAALQNQRYSSIRDFIRIFARTILSSKAIIRICIVVMVIALVMSRSRMGNIAFFSSMTVTAIISLFLIKKRSQGMYILIISMFVVDLFIVSAYFGLEKVQERLTQTNITQESRDEVYSDAIGIVSDYPLLGTGGGSFYTIFPGYQRSNVSGFYDQAHNDYLQFVIEFGLIGILFLGLLTLLALYSALRAMRKRRNPILKGASFGCSMAIFGMGIHILVDFPLQAYGNTAYFIALLALSFLVLNIKIEPKNKSTLEYFS